MRTKKIKISYALFLTIIIFTLAQAHKEIIHQYMCKEALTLLQKSFPTQLSEMRQFLGNDGEPATPANLKYLCSGTSTILSGAWIEDHADIVYYYGNDPVVKPSLDQGFAFDAISAIWGNPHKAFTSVTHFWDADNGIIAPTSLSDNCTALQLFWSFTIPENAYQKIKKYQNGDFLYRFYYTKVFYLQECDYLFRILDWQWAQIKNIYNNQSVTVNRVGSQNLSTGDWYWFNTNCPSMIYGKDYAYEILGRMIHLLEDMSVPEHVHNDNHAKEQGMRSSFLEDNELNYKKWTAEEIWNRGEKFINPYFMDIPNSDPIYNLMYTVNQITDHYASCSKNGDNDYDHRFFIISKTLSKLGMPQSVADINDPNCRAMNDVLQPLTIRAVAGLMYWFACEVGMLTEVPSTDNKKVDISPIIALLLN